MSNAKTRRKLPQVKVVITIKPTSAANRALWQRFWARLLTENIPSATGGAQQSDKT